jgi:glycosyltransferase involved in cell wall biosynthesis
MIEMLRVADVVSIRDAMTQEELRRVYQQASIFVLPCLQLDDGDRDGIPNVLAEAMAMGIPVISTAISGIPELIEDGTDGLLVSERDSVSLAGALRRLIESPKLRQQLSEAGRRKVCRNFDSRRTTIRLAELFAAAIHRAAANT